MAELPGAPVPNHARGRRRTRRARRTRPQLWVGALLTIGVVLAIGLRGRTTAKRVVEAPRSEQDSGSGLLDAASSPAEPTDAGFVLADVSLAVPDAVVAELRDTGFGDAEASADAADAQGRVEDANEVVAFDASSPDSSKGGKDAAEPTTYSIQIRSFPTVEEADAFAQSSSVAAQALPASVVSTELSGRGVWYRVRLGSFSTREAAEAAKEQLGALGEGAIVVSNR